MRTKFDLTNAQAVVDEYVATLSDPNRIPTRTSCRTWIEFCLERHGIIPSVRGCAFMESHALWYACLIVTGSVRRVSRIETKILRRPGQGTTERTIRQLLGRTGIVGNAITGVYLREILDSVHHEAVA